MHNLILEKINPENVIDHIDHNTLNNTKSNLREITKIQNAQNISTILSHSKTGYRNITIDKGKYRVRINKKSFGRYDTLEEAIEVAKKERAKIFPITSDINNKTNLNNLK